MNSELEKAKNHINIVLGIMEASDFNVLNCQARLKEASTLIEGKGEEKLLLDFAKYAMPDNYTQLALNNIVRTFLEENKPQAK